jgi:large subunit ribosomal protein L3
MLESDEENPPYLVRDSASPDPEHFDSPPFQNPRHARPGQNVVDIGTSKAFRGHEARFQGMPATHSVSKSHRALGSTGQCRIPAGLLKVKMAGRMGTDRVTVQEFAHYQD